MPPFPLDDFARLTGRKLHHCYFVTLCVPCFLFPSVNVIFLMNIQDGVQHRFAVYINCGIFSGHVYIIV